MVNYRIYSRTSEMGLIMYAEWRAMCDMTLGILCKLLQGANPSPDLVEFISNSNNDIHPSIQKRLPIIRIWWVDLHIPAFLSVSHLSTGIGIILINSFTQVSLAVHLCNLHYHLFVSIQISLSRLTAHHEISGFYG